MLTRHCRHARSVGREYPPAAPHRASPPARTQCGRKAHPPHARAYSRVTQCSLPFVECAAQCGARALGNARRVRMRARCSLCSAGRCECRAWRPLARHHRTLGCACSLPGRRRLWHAGSQPRWQDRVLPASWCSDPPITSKRRPGPWCSTLPAKCQWARRAPRPAGSGAGPCPAGRWKARLRPGRLTGRPGAVQRHGPGRARPTPGGYLGREVRAGRPVRSCDLGLDGQVQPAAALMAVGFGSLP